MVEPWTKKGQTSTRQRRQPAAPRGLGRWQCGEWFWRRHLKPLLTSTDEPLDDACDICAWRDVSVSPCHLLPRARLTAAVSCAQGLLSQEDRWISPLSLSAVELGPDVS
jgi:hypothetical protein